jgi:hypothetical protein
MVLAVILDRLAMSEVFLLRAQFRVDTLRGAASGNHTIRCMTWQTAKPGAEARNRLQWWWNAPRS